MTGPPIAPRTCACAITLCLVVPIPHDALGSDRESSDSVVQIRCALSDGAEMKATGFVWPVPGQVVTALHAVAGCAQIVVYSEAKGVETVATEILSVDLEADLALIRLEEDLGVPEVGYADQPPDTRAEYFAWGYPVAAEEMIDLEIEFGGGRKAGVTTLGSAFSSTELDQLFRDQSYPNYDTKILRVNTTIQPGHSGAPIFDGEGDVVAIADGGLLGGWRGINWSIPAYVYLPGLPESTDEIPEAASQWAGLFSNFSTERTASVELGPLDATLDPDEVEQPDVLNLVGQISLSEVVDMFGLAVEGSAADKIMALLDDPAQFEDLGFDIYEDSQTGATVGVPAGAELFWNDDLGAVQMLNDRGTVQMSVAVQRAASFSEAVEVNAARFEEWMSQYAAWYESEEPSQPSADEYDEATESARYFHVLQGDDVETGANAEMQFGMYISGPVFLGTSVYAVWSEDDGTSEDEIHYMLAEIAAQFLTDFAVN